MRSAAAEAISGSTPFSNRAEASERRPCRFEVRPIDAGSHHANSTSTSPVVSEISVDAPPITPARPIGVSLPSTITPSSLSSPRLCPSRVTIDSPDRARRTPRWEPPTFARS